ncbi:MAG: METTL5 family protein [archaeon]
MTKKHLAVTLSKLKVFAAPNTNLEQYPTDSEIAADVLWFADLNGDIQGKIVADLGAGTGILGIGCLLLGARKVYFVEKDKEAIKVLKENLQSHGLKNHEIISEDIVNFHTKVDVVVQNPPFGTKEKHTDRFFLDKASTLANTIYSFHKTETKGFIDNYTRDLGFETTHYFEFDFPLKKTMEQHRKKIERIHVGCWRISKIYTTKI